MEKLIGTIMLFAIGIAAATMSIAADPETLTGVVNKAPEMSFCMDGATHVLLIPENGRTNTTRLKPKTGDVEKQLNQLLNANVTVTGRKNVGVECKAFEVSSVMKAAAPANPK